MRYLAATAALLAVLASPATAQTLGGALPPLFPADNWWRTDISGAPVDGNSTNFINFIGATTGMHPDFGGENEEEPGWIYGIPYITVNGSQPKVAVQFLYSDQSDGVDHGTDTSYPFYPIPTQAITQSYWIEGGPPGNVDLRDEEDRHMLIVDTTNNHLYELYNVYYDGTQWYAGSGAFFDLTRNDRRPDTWTSADAAGLAMLPGLVRYEEVYGSAEIEHAFRMTVEATNGYVYPASHEAGDTAGALPMGARLRLKAGKNISGYPPEIQRIFRAFKKYGLIIADNGSDMYVSGTFDTRWNNDVLNPAFASLKASDFEVVQLGWQPPPPPPSALGTDFNRDGRTDLALQHTDGRAFAWYLSDGTVIGGGWINASPLADWRLAGGGDVDGDGNADVVWQHTDGRVYAWYLNGVTTRGGAWLNGSPLASWRVAAVDDVDRDGRSDLVWQHTDGSIYLWYVRPGGSVVAAGYIYATPLADWLVTGSGDFNGDSRTDLVLQHTDGRVFVWYMNGASVVGGGYIQATPLADWRVAGTGRIDAGTGRDLVWQHPDGRTFAWILNGLTTTGGRWIQSTPLADWKVKAAR